MAGRDSGWMERTRSVDWCVICGGCGSKGRLKVKWVSLMKALKKTVTEECILIIFNESSEEKPQP